MFWVPPAPGGSPQPWSSVGLPLPSWTRSAVCRLARVCSCPVVVFLALLCLVSVSEKSELLLRARHLGVCTRLNDAGLGRLPLCEGWLWSPSCLRRGQAPCALGNLESATACGLPRTTTLVMVACRLEQTCGGGRVDPWGKKNGCVAAPLQGQCNLGRGARPPPSCFSCPASAAECGRVASVAVTSCAKKKKPSPPGEATQKKV